MRIKILPVAFALAMATGCTSGTDKTAGHKPDPVSEAAGTPAGNVTEQARVVVIEQMKFVPDTITVKKGDTILFVNKDIVPHDVTGVDQHWASGTLAPGSSWRFVPRQDGDYFCSIHVVMKGRITVH
ncbi:plastocyanin/azurin family copper-binding protein [Niabella drilacis]|uniref:Plastocyanin n=1 Tax=Niabella drilacis (strain DSM 25811 / CCM 8410 / CCUG 62505 / LMG 26954 / E90) TaxID=1285928 RepID=A0A1G6PJT4_NIADE|nr:plastocyanin/azurin family copper-binding protein [Niabella drilacis]SDC80433.1 Plastocyanin [Niabella drilacis]